MSILARRSRRNPPTAERVANTPSRISIPAPDKHWYVPCPESDGYCLACGLPERNGRHVARRG